MSLKDKIDLAIKAKKEEQEREQFMAMARTIPGYAAWKEAYDRVGLEKKRRQEAFELVLALIPKFENFTLPELAWMLGIPRKSAGRVLRHWRDKGKVILLTEQTIGHPYRIVVKQ